MKSNKGLIEVRASKIIKAKKWKVLRFLSRVQDFPRYMLNVKKCELLQKGPDTMTTSWLIEIDKIPLSWKEIDTFDRKNFSIHFNAIEGDLEHFEGDWSLKDHFSETEVVIQARIKIGLPQVEEVIGSILAEKVKKNFESMLDAMDEALTMRHYKNIGFRHVSDLKGFAVVGHPYNMQHLIRYFRFFKPDFKLPSQEFLVKLFELTPAYRSYDIKNFESKTGKRVNGSFIMCPIIPDMLVMGLEKVIEKVVDACKVAEQLGAGIVTLGGFTSIAGELYGKSLTSLVNVPITTGNALTVAMVLNGIYKAADLMGIDLDQAKVTIIGGTGDIGGSCARILAEQVEEITITSRSEKNLMEIERILSYYGKAAVKTSRNNNEAVQGADIIIAAASSSNTIVDFNNFKAGAVICDVGYPKNISYTACDRKDILIFSGGIASLPSEFNLGFDIGLPSSRVLYGCWAEAIVLDLEERYENFSWGKGNITKEKVNFISQIAKKHGFELAPFFWGNKMIQDKEIATIAKARIA